MCGGFSCSKNALIFLNIVYLQPRLNSQHVFSLIYTELWLISFILIGVASYAKAAAVITSFEIAGGIIASGLFLFLIAVLGLIAVSKHHQVLLFFYIIILFLLFFIQFIVSIMCLMISEEQVSSTIQTQWGGPNNTSSMKNDAQSTFICCGWMWNQSSCHESCLQSHEYCVCENTATPSAQVSNIKLCKPCADVIPKSVSDLLEATGGIGLFFSFTEMIGVWLAVRYRNQKDPNSNPSELF